MPCHSSVSQSVKPLILQENKSLNTEGDIYCLLLLSHLITLYCSRCSSCFVYLHFALIRVGIRSKSLGIVFGRCHYLDLHVFQFTFCLERAISGVVCCCRKAFQHYCHVYSILDLLSQWLSAEPQHLALISLCLSSPLMQKTLLLFSVFQLIESE